MSDDIIDTIAVAVGRHEYWQLLVSEDWECACGEAALFKVEMDQHIAKAVAAALRGAGYEIVTTEEAKLISLENQPPSAPVAAEADQ